MFDEIMRWGNIGAPAYTGIAANQADLQGMTSEQLAEYQRRQGDPRNVAMSMTLRQLAAMQAVPMVARKPTMSLAEYDVARSAFRHSEEKKDS